MLPTRQASKFEIPRQIVSWEHLTLGLESIKFIKTIHEMQLAWVTDKWRIPDTQYFDDSVGAHFYMSVMRQGKPRD